MAKHDFFISYKWARYSKEAAEIAEIAKVRDYTIWIDRENPPETTTDEGLAEHLRSALGSCRYIIFFETYTHMAAVVNGPPVRVISWQERELNYAEASRLIVLYRSQDPSRISFGTNRNLYPYRDLNDALDQVEKAMTDPDLFTSQRSPYGGSGGAGDCLRHNPGRSVASAFGAGLAVGS